VKIASKSVIIISYIQNSVVALLVYGEVIWRW